MLSLMSLHSKSKSKGNAPIGCVEYVCTNLFGLTYLLVYVLT
jgi:hypothetical protein